ncbi:MAG: branched-chain amino acid ABC transporter permease [Armatimonadota bacterium]|nr:branched-chain amino acid ABC transporter permease [Armatimonadota bacterium]MDR7455282.1 branched-chain amino acid ABC transporter permease [Armatimonadota bacterium]MDR7455804.1 branched-chain amino acid ABC transporter permease [Armatimonadota bacterium]MDR7512339.1 branched-chain amino acid ABC transporter permease [Armatimonadota bacterium]
MFTPLAPGRAAPGLARIPLFAVARTLVERYEDDLYLVKGPAAWTAVAALLIGLAALPFLLPRLGMGYLLFIAVLASANVIVAVGLNLLVGYAGLISLGHAGFVAIGAYASGLLAARLEVPWPAAWLGAAAISAAFGFLVGLPALRLTGPYLTIATLGFGIAVYQVLTNWTELSGGRGGLSVPALGLGVGGMSAIQQLALVAITAAVALCWIAYNLARSHIGRALAAIRDSDIAAEVTGVSLTWYKTLAFAISAAYAGVAGAIIAQALRHLEPQAFTFLESITYFAMIVVGGLGTVTGGIIGALLLTLIPHYLSGIKQWLPIAYGAVIIAMMLFEPQGLYGRWLRIRRYFKAWPL